MAGGIGAGLARGGSRWSEAPRASRPCEAKAVGATPEREAMASAQTSVHLPRGSAAAWWRRRAPPHEVSKIGPGGSGAVVGEEMRGEGVAERVNAAVLLDASARSFAIM